MAKRLADTVDKHALYQRAVQSPEEDVEILQYFYQQHRNHPAYHFREDFCGTALTLSHWVRQGDNFSGEGFDIDTDTLNWGQQHNYNNALLDRTLLHAKDVREPSKRAPDIRCAFNFSYWLFMTREELGHYFRTAYEDLAENGMLALDAHGGPDAASEEEYETDCGDFNIVWHQTDFSPVTRRANLALHFRFDDGSEITDAFTYRWRLWTLPELQELLYEAGFSTVHIYWYTEDEADGHYTLTNFGSNDRSWIACLVALK